MRRALAGSLCVLIMMLCLAGCGGGGDEPAPPTPTPVTVTAKLVRADGTELDFDAKPIPVLIAIRATFSQAMDPATIEAATSLTDATGAAVPGTFAWNAENTVVTFTPSAALDPKTTYTVSVTYTSVSAMVVEDASAKQAQQLTLEASFTTMTPRDVNGDGYADALMAAPNATVGAKQPGQAYLFLGGTSFTGALSASSASSTITGVRTGDFLGMSLNSAGDINADGYADIIVGSVASGPSGQGQAFLFLGSASGIASCDLETNPGCADATLTGVTAGDEFGSAVGAAGDVNGDGYDDVIVGAWSCEDLVHPGENPGRAYLFLGGSGLTGAIGADSANAVITGSADKDYFGWSVAGAGDVNGDGYDDIIVGASGNTPYYASIFHGGPALAGSLTPAVNAATTLIGDGNTDHFGNSVSTAGDINGDGLSDVIVGAPQANDGATLKAGKAYVFLGVASGIPDCNIGTTPGCAHATIIGVGADDALGGSVAPAGDTNADGYADIIVGATENTVTDDGYACVFGRDRARRQPLSQQPDRRVHLQRRRGRAGRRVREHGRRPQRRHL